MWWADFGRRKLLIFKNPPTVSKETNTGLVLSLRPVYDRMLGYSDIILTLALQIQAVCSL